MRWFIPRQQDPRLSSRSPGTIPRFPGMQYYLVQPPLLRSQNNLPLISGYLGSNFRFEIYRLVADGSNPGHWFGRCVADGEILGGCLPTQAADGRGQTPRTPWSLYPGIIRHCIQAESARAFGLVIYLKMNQNCWPGNNWGPHQTGKWFWHMRIHHESMCARYWFMIALIIRTDPSAISPGATLHPRTGYIIPSGEKNIMMKSAGTRMNHRPETQSYLTWIRRSPMSEMAPTSRFTSTSTPMIGAAAGKNRPAGETPISGQNRTVFPVATSRRHITC